MKYFNYISIFNKDAKVTTLSAQKSRKVVAERSYYDTYEFIQSLVAKGFTQAQAEQLCFLFKDIVNYIAQDIKKECVSKPGQVCLIFIIYFNNPKIINFMYKY